MTGLCAGVYVIMLMRMGSTSLSDISQVDNVRALYGMTAMALCVVQLLLLTFLDSGPAETAVRD
eukprot:CAMPEP_0179479674 /NCGR_PEP_ID=MMETSP0799-20121207/57855_1 /TAXON_ID=46947 /ORGANISM="Geminigera cryophila, Strain CCMP2564" /LENGTH=63 /DNA_ID=CAMNT_0021291423 /DNA_START=483 /DNA_END=671 /DNA_ORIENTATION=-